MRVFLDYRGMTEHQRLYEMYWYYYNTLHYPLYLKYALFWRAAWKYGKPVALALYPNSLYYKSQFR